MFGVRAHMGKSVQVRFAKECLVWATPTASETTRLTTSGHRRPAKSRSPNSVGPVSSPASTCRCREGGLRLSPLLQDLSDGVAVFLYDPRQDFAGMRRVLEREGIDNGPMLLFQARGVLVFPVVD